MTQTDVAHSRRARVAFGAAFAFFATIACGGGGGDKATGPVPVATVEVTAPSTSVEVGSNLIVSVRYFDAKHNQLTGRAITYTTSNATIATVSSTGLVAGVAVGSASISATVDGVAGSLSISVVAPPVAAITFSPATPVVRQGETITLTAQPVDVVGRPVVGKAVTWSSANLSVATVNATGAVTGVAAGSAYIRAEVDGKRDSVSLRVRGLNAPAITGVLPTSVAPGSSLTITGTNFGATPNDNEVKVNGALAAITSASVTSITFTVPSASALPCSATGPARIQLVANADTAVTTGSTLRMATQRTLGIGESMLLTSAADLACNEFTGTGGKYLVTVFNYATTGSVNTSFQVYSGAAVTAASQSQLRAPAAVGTPFSAPFSPSSLIDPRLARHARAHLEWQRQERAFARQYGDPHLPGRIKRNRAALSVASAVNPPPAVGSMATYRMKRTFTNAGTYDEVRFRVVYVGPHIILLEDSLAPLAGTMDAEYQRMGQEFDDITWNVLLNFGNPTVVDSALDNNGRIIALFSKRVNDYVVNGVSNSLLGFVTLCDYFPRVQTVVNGVTIPACPSSNEAEAFYAIVPNPTGTGALSVSDWRRYMRATLAHESKHITSYAERYYRDAEEVEDVDIEEATAQMASEIFSLKLYARQQQADVRWADGPQCDYAPSSGTCPDPFEGILHHFNFYYDHLVAMESHSILDDPTGPVDAVIYGSTWAFMRWVTDLYGGPDQGVFLRSIVQVKNDRGVANIVTHTGKPFSELLGYFSLAAIADDYPGGTVNDPRLKLPSWDTRDVFFNMNAHLVFSGSQTPAFPRAWPPDVRSVAFGPFPAGAGRVDNLKGGSFAGWEISGTQTVPQVLAIRDLNGGPPPALIGLAIVRVQ
jgi:hypothetical protein